MHETFAMMNPFGSGWHLDRAAFDEALREHVRLACSTEKENNRRRIERGTFVGVQKDEQGWTVTAEELDTKDRKKYHSTWLVDASGRRATVAHKVWFCYFPTNFPNVLKYLSLARRKDSEAR